ncbi:MAG: hypothetical protein QM733_11015 [Ilumatobacteraceae bacterium]
MNTKERHRLTFAIALTVVALPALWMSSREQAATTGVPTAAAVGIDTPDAVESQGAVVVTVTTYQPQSPVFLGDGSGGGDGTVSSVAVVEGTAPSGHHADVRASYRRYRSATGCTASVTGGGVKITVTNLSNGQSIVCRNDLSVTLPQDIGILVNTDLFAQIANLANAPVAVRISW